jgi:hypothetical protein
VRKFQSVVDAAEGIVFFLPGGEVSVYRFEIRDGENVPSFFYIDRYFDEVAVKAFERDGDFVEEAGIDEQFAGALEGGYELRQVYGVAAFERQLALYDIGAGFPVAGDDDVTN